MGIYGLGFRDVGTQGSVRLEGCRAHVLGFVVVIPGPSFGASCSAFRVSPENMIGIEGLLSECYKGSEDCGIPVTLNPKS